MGYSTASTARPCAVPSTITDNPTSCHNVAYIRTCPRVHVRMHARTAAQTHMPTHAVVVRRGRCGEAADVLRPPRVSLGGGALLPHGPAAAPTSHHPLVRSLPNEVIGGQDQTDSELQLPDMRLRYWPVTHGSLYFYTSVFWYCSVFP